MLTNRSYWIGRHLPLLSPDNDGGGNGSGTEGDPKSGAETTNENKNKNEVEKGDDKEALRRMGEQRDAAREDARKAAEERDALKAEKDQREADEQKRKDEEAAKSGQWEALATKREGELTAAKNEATSLKAENDQLRSIISDALKVAEKTLPDSVRDILNDTVPDETNVVERYAWLQKPSVQKQIQLAASKDPAHGNGRDPKSSGAGTRSVEDEARLINRTGNYAM